MAKKTTEGVDLGLSSDSADEPTEENTAAAVPLGKFDVEIPMCALGRMRVEAVDEAAALAEYMRRASITHTSHLPTIIKRG